MSKARKVARIFKFVVKTFASVLLEILRLVLPLIPRLFGEIFKEINKRLRFSITFKTTVTYTLLFTIILLILGALFTGAFGYFLIYNTGQSLEKDSRVVAGFIEENSGIPQDKIKKFAELKKISVTLFDENTRVIYTTAEGISEDTASRRDRFSDAISIDEKMRNLYFETPAHLNNGVRSIEAAKDLSEERLYLAGLAITMAAAFCVAILIMIIIGARTSRKMLRPINTMTRTARSISVGDLHTRLDVVDSHDELKELAVTFNEMLDRIQASFDKQDVFVSDASHELRTPIAVIQGYANLLQRWGKEDRAVLQESIDAIKSESDYMKELVEKLLFLASADKKQRRLETAPFALNELAEEVLKETALIDAEHTISGENKDAVVVDGDRALIKQAMRIFVDNSVKYTPAGGLIMINSSLKGARALIAIEDNGMGISPEDLPHIFDRFYKADKSRTRESGGAGLGLSIAKWIVDQHRGEIRVESRHGKGTRITILLPAIES